MHQRKFKTGYAIQRRKGRKAPFWQARYFDFICRRNKDVSNKLRYIHENPVAAGIVARAEMWSWSSASHYAGSSNSKLAPDFMEFSGDPNELLWPATWRPL